MRGPRRQEMTAKFDDLMRLSMHYRILYENS